MKYYSGRLIINNHTDFSIKDSKEHNLVGFFRFSASFNKNKLYLNNTILSQLLESGAVQKYIHSACSEYYINNEADFLDKVKRIMSIEPMVNINIKIIGKYFYIKIYCGRNHSTDDILNAIKRKLKKEKDIIEILKG